MSQSNPSHGEVITSLEGQLDAMNLCDNVQKLSQDINDPKNDHLFDTTIAEDLEDDFSGDEEDGVLFTGLSLGFTEDPENPISMRRDYFPSKFGGRPAWLDPKNLPATSSLFCKHCSNPYRFLMQVYAPYSDIDNAFHRTVYVFACSSGKCVLKNNSIQVYRSQLSRNNEFYSANPPVPASQAEYDPNLPMDYLPFKNINVCAICALPATETCPSCNAIHYCSKAHQEKDYEIGHKLGCTGDVVSKKDKTSHFVTRESLLYPCLEIVIEEEALELDEDSKDHAKNLITNYETEQNKLTSEQKAADAEEIHNLFGEGETEVEAEAEAEGESEIINVSTPSTEGEKIEGSENIETQQKSDPIFVAFQTRVSYNPEQVVRYIPRSKRVNAVAKSKSTGKPLTQSVLPLWISNTKRLATSSVPQCSKCGCERDFEFQIMPQVLYMLEQAEEDRNVDFGIINNEKNDDDGLDFGTIAIYTCRNSCFEDDKSVYQQEYVYVQPPFM